MSFELAILSHVGAVVAGAAGTFVYLRHISGWVSAFEHQIAQDVAHLKQVVFGVRPAVPSMLPAAPAGGTVPSQAPGTPPVPVTEFSSK